MRFSKTSKKNTIVAYRDTEIFVNYGYGMEYAPDWYRDLWKKHKKMKRLQSGKNITSI